MTDSTRVDPDALLDVGSRLFQRSQEFLGAVQPPLLPVVNGPQGVSRMEEAVALARACSGALDAYQQFIDDAHRGLTSLSYVAVDVAEAYRSSDADQGNQMLAVQQALAPPPGVASVAGDAAFQRALDVVRTLFPARATPVPDDDTSGPALPTTGSSRWTRYTDAVEAHDEYVGGDAHAPDSAEEDHDQRAAHDDAVRRAAEASEHDNIPYVVTVDAHGNSEVVQADPDDVPHPDPAPSYTNLDPQRSTYAPYGSTG